MKEKRSQWNLPKKSIWEPELVSSVLRESKSSPKHAYKLWNYLIKQPTRLEEVPYSDWTCSKKASKAFKEDFTLFTTTVVQRDESSRGDTTKLLVELQDGHRVETVVIRHRAHSTVCVSSQVGCQMGCKFCATGTMGIIGDLTAGEIIEQVIHANQVTKIRNVVFMGMGEPLNNWENVKSAVEFLIDTRTLGLAARHVTVSTVGVIHNMRRLTQELPTVNMALSLHAPNQEVRLKIVPTAKAHKFDKLIEALDYHLKNAKRKSSKLFLRESAVMIEYILIKNVNDRPEHAHELGKLLGPRKHNILLNLIPYNPTDVADDFYPPSQDDIQNFFDIVTSDEYGVYCRVRQEMGQDIDGACGQLALKSHAEKSAEGEEKRVDIEEVSSGERRSIQKKLGGRVRKLRNESPVPQDINVGLWSFRSLAFGGSFFAFSTLCLVLYRQWYSRK